jgi:hypothetical protein
VNIAGILQLLEAEQARIAKDALEKPASDLFNHGRAVGVYAGIGLAKEAILSLYQDDEKRGRNL